MLLQCLGRRCRKRDLSIGRNGRVGSGSWHNDGGSQQRGKCSTGADYSKYSKQMNWISAAQQHLPARCGSGLGCDRGGPWRFLEEIREINFR